MSFKSEILPIFGHQTKWNAKPELRKMKLKISIKSNRYTLWVTRVLLLLKAFSHISQRYFLALWRTFGSALKRWSRLPEKKSLKIDICTSIARIKSSLKIIRDDFWNCKGESRENEKLKFITTQKIHVADPAIAVVQMMLMNSFGVVVLQIEIKQKSTERLPVESFDIQMHKKRNDNHSDAYPEEKKNILKKFTP